MHYKRWHKHGDPFRIKPTTEQRFWAKVQKCSGDDPCWLWTGTQNTTGHGKFNPAHGPMGAHVFAYELLRGTVPKGMHLDHRHTCPKHCVNPAHLRIALPKQNGENRGGLNKNNTSGYRGVHWCKRRNKWIAQVKHNRKQIRIGYFDDVEAANAAVVEARNRYFTHNDLDRESA